MSGQNRKRIGLQQDYTKIMAASSSTHKLTMQLPQLWKKNVRLLGLNWKLCGKRTLIIRHVRPIIQTVWLKVSPSKFKSNNQTYKHAIDA
jgi:uncharacterized oligopeptide transporter (OPT) family protein